MAKAKETTVLNPLSEGVTYEAFLASIGSTKIKDALADICSEAEITWIENEIQEFKNNLKK